MKKIILILIFSAFTAGYCFAAVSVVGELSREKTVSPGDKIEGVILLKNHEDQALQVKVYKTDYLFYADGRNIYGEPGKAARSNANWISLRPSQLTLPAGETSSVYYTIEVPEKADLSGTYWSMIMVESLPAKALKELRKEQDKVTMGFQTLIRYGIQIVTDIRNTGSRSIKFLDKKLVSQDSRKFMQIDIENTGERWLNPFVWLELYSQDGKSMGRFEANRMRIYPGCSIRQVIDLSEVPKGRYKGLVVVDAGGQDVFGAQYDFELGYSQKIKQETQTETKVEKPRRPSNFSAKFKSWFNQTLKKIKQFFQPS